VTLLAEHRAKMRSYTKKQQPANTPLRSLPEFPSLAPPNKLVAQARRQIYVLPVFLSWLQQEKRSCARL